MGRLNAEAPPPPRLPPLTLACQSFCPSPDSCPAQYLTSLCDDGQSAVLLQGAPVSYGHHKWACSELWSLSWLSSLARESAEWCSAAMPENSDGSSVPFFTFTSSFSRAAAPCWPPFTLFHFILRFWNQTFTCRAAQGARGKVSVRDTHTHTHSYKESLQFSAPECS